MTGLPHEFADTRDSRHDDDEKLDEALEESFPASDPPAIDTRDKTGDHSVETLPFRGVRIVRELEVGFEEVTRRLAGAMGEMSVGAVNDIAAAGGSPDDFRDAIRARLGPSGFTRFGVIDHGAWLGIFGHQRRLERWILGNPLIAEKMISLDRTAGLFAPVELLIDERGPECTRITTVLPSSLIAIDASAELRRIAQTLDGKLRTLIALAG